MSELKCPFCNQELDRDLKGECGCINEKCQKSVFMFGSEELWQELIRTRKALEIAIDALKDNLSQANFREMLDASRFHCIRTKCESALNEITALEQKDK